MSRLAAADVLGTTTLITGANEFVAERTVSERPGRGLAADADADVSELPAARPRRRASWPRSPARRCSRRSATSWSAPLEDLPDDAVDPLVEYVGAPAPDVALVLHHTGGSTRQGRARQAPQGRGQGGQGRGR